MLVTIAKPNSGVVISCVGAATTAKLYLNPESQPNEFVKLLSECNVARLHIHHCLGHERYLHKLVDTLALPFDVTIHDYYLLSPQPHLVGADGRFVGEDLFAAAEALLEAGFAPIRPSSLEEWQRQHRWLLTDADRVIVPSNDTKRRIATAVPTRPLVLAAHPDDGIEMPITVWAPCKGDSSLRIAVVGEINQHKGSRVILECARLAKARVDPLQFHIIGAAHNAPELLRAGVSVTGPFQHDHLPRLLEEWVPHLIWYPAQCPETFSYTLSEGLKTRLPIVVSDLGALPERVGGVPWVWIQPWNIDPRQWNDFFISIRARHFFANEAPPVIGATWEVTDDFYRDRYLNWIVAGDCI